jgi:hypothetical protein
MRRIKIDYGIAGEAQFFNTNKTNLDDGEFYEAGGMKGKPISSDEFNFKVGDKIKVYKKKEEGIHRFFNLIIASVEETTDWLDDKILLIKTEEG